MHHFFEAITNTDGQSLIGYFARVVNPTTQMLVPIYSDNSGTPVSVISGVTNAAKTDDYGNLSLYVDPGTYHLDIYGSDSTTFLFRVSNIAMNSTKGDTGDKGDPGDPGPALATFFTLASFKAAPTSNATQVLQASGVPAGTFIWTLGNYTGQADDVNIIKADSTSLSVGAWVRQKADGIAASLPGFPAIVKTLGDALPYISPGEFFGIKSDGTDDTLALRAAIEAVANRSNGPGGVLSLKPGGTARTGDQTIVKPFVILELNGGTIQPNLNGGNTAGLRMMSDATVRGGMIDVRSTGSPGIQVSIHSPILLGVPYGEGGTVASPSVLDNVSRVLIEDMVLLSNKDLGPVASGGATGIHLVGNVHDCIARRIRIPANNKMQGAIGIDWGIRGEVAGAQAIFSDPTKMAQNRTNFDAGNAFTTHPHDNHFSDFLIEALSRPYQVGIVDSGTFAGRNSGGYGNSFRRFHALQTTESGAVSHVGDLGFEFAKGADLARAFLGNVFEDFVIEEVGTGVGIKSDSDADNVRRAIADYAYSARFAPTWKTDIVFNRVKARTTNAVDGEQGGLYCFRQNGGTFVDIDMRGFGIGARYVGATDITDTGGRYTFSKRQNISLEGGCARIEFVNLRDVSYGNRIGATYSNVHFQSADLCAIRGGSVGAMASDESARHAILLNAPGDGNQRTTLSGVRINSHGSGGFGVVAASSSAWGTLQVIENITYGSFVTNTYTGELAQPIRRRGAGLGADYVMPQAGNLSDTLTTLSGKSVLQGETFDYSNPAAGGKKGLVAVAAGPASSTTLKPFGAIDA